MAAMNLNNFKVLKEDDDSYEVGHPSGKKITVKKAGLSKKAHEMIKMYAEGTPNEPVSSSDSAPEVAMPVPAAPAAAPDLSKLPDLVPTEPSRAPASELQTNPTASGTPTGEVAPTINAIGQAQVAQQQAQMDPLLQQKVATADVLRKQEQQINDYTKATQQINNQTAQFYKDYATKSDANQKTHEQFQTEMKAKDDALLKAYSDNKIDPNRFYKNQSTGSRIASSIGLILSGAGSAVTGGPNLAMQQLQKAVDADIEAQKNEQGKNMNLFSMNREALGDDMRAQAATQNQLLTGVQAKVGMATAQAQNPGVKLRGQQMINDLEQQKLQNRMQIGLLSQGGGQPGAQGNLSGADPAVLVPMFIKDPGQQKEAYAEIQKAQDASRSYQEMLKLVDEAGKRNTVLRTGAGMLRTPVAVASLENLALPLIRDQVGRVSEFEHDAFKHLMPQPGDTDAKVADKKQAMIDFWRSKMSAPVVKGASNGAIDLTKFSSTALPLPAKTAVMNGMQYEKVPGGWKKVQGS